VVVCEGTDFAGHMPALDFDLNADLANELDCPVLVVVSGNTPEAAVEAARVARESLRHKGCDLFGVFVNRVPLAVLREVTTSLADEDADRPVYVLPEQRELASPTVGEVASALAARPLFAAAEKRSASWAGASLTLPGAGDELMHRDVRAVRIAAMSVEHFIDGLEEGQLVIVPGDRPDVLVASITCTLSSAFPSVAAVVLTGGYQLHPSIRRLLEVAPFPVFEADSST
jgi:phosphate acetyltransferase